MRVGFNFLNQVKAVGVKTKLNNNIKISQTSDSVSFTSTDNELKNKIGETFTDGIRIRIQAAKEKKVANYIMNDAKNVQAKMKDIKAVSVEKFKKFMEEKVESDKIWKDYTKLFEQTKSKKSGSYTDELTGYEIKIDKSGDETIIEEIKDGQIVKKTSINYPNGQETVDIEIIGSNGNPTKIYNFRDGVISSISINPQEITEEMYPHKKISYDERIAFEDGEINSISENYKHSEDYAFVSYDKNYFYKKGELSSYTEGYNKSLGSYKIKENYIIRDGQFSSYEKNTISLLRKDDKLKEVEYSYKNGELVDATIGHSEKYAGQSRFIDFEGKYNFENGKVTKIVKDYGSFHDIQPWKQTEYIFKDGKLEGYNYKFGY